MKRKRLTPKMCAFRGCDCELRVDHPQLNMRNAFCQACVFKIANNNNVALPSKFKEMTDDAKETWAREKLPGFEHRKSKTLDVRIYNEWQAHKTRLNNAHNLILESAGWYSAFVRYKQDNYPPVHSPLPPTQSPAPRTQSPAPPT
jgi:hypothetical protein